MTKIYTVLCFCLFGLISLTAQSSFHLDITAGMSVGSPIPKKSDQPSESSGKPGIMATGGLIGVYDIAPKWTINLGVQYTKKGNSFTTTTDGKYDVARAILGENFPFGINVPYDGVISGQFANQYFDFPLYVNYEAGRLHFLLGYQYSRLLKAKFDGEADLEVLFSFLKISDFQWDESARMAKNDHALLVGFEYEFGDTFSVGTQVNYALSKVFKEESEGFSGMRNVYGKILMKFRLF